MTTFYESHLHTGSGWTKAILTFLDDSHATTYFDSRWMGSDAITRYRLNWKKKELSERHGLLQLESCERYLSWEGDATQEVDWTEVLSEPESDPDRLAAYKDVSFEYFFLGSTMYIADDPGLEQMRMMGLASWHKEFELLVVLRFALAEQEGKWSGSMLRGVILALDKTKYTRIGNPVFGWEGSVSPGFDPDIQIDDELPF